MELKAVVSGRHLLCSREGKMKLTLYERKSGSIWETVYEIEGGKLEIEGLIKGKTVANIVGEITCFDTWN